MDRRVSCNSEVVMEQIVDDALIERVLTYLPFVVYDGRAGCFVLRTQRGYVDANDLGLARTIYQSAFVCFQQSKDKRSLVCSGRSGARSHSFGLPKHPGGKARMFYVKNTPSVQSGYPSSRRLVAVFCIRRA